MSVKKQHIPTYSLEQFSSKSHAGISYQVEVFDANRHFEVQYPHRHDFFEVLFLSQGSGIHIIDDNSYQIHPPCIFFLSPGQAHKLELSKDIEGYIYLFTPEFYLINRRNINSLLELPFFYNIHAENPPLELHRKEESNFVQSLFKRAVYVSESNHSNKQNECLALLDTILATSKSLYPVQLDHKDKGKGHILVKQFRQLIEENYQFNYSINQYADLLHITPNHLTQTVKEVTGKTSTQLVAQKQILEAKRLLVHSDLSATEIALQLNFMDQSYFTKFFKRHTQLTPNQYRTKSMKST